MDKPLFITVECCKDCHLHMCDARGKFDPDHSEARFKAQFQFLSMEVELAIPNITVLCNKIPIQWSDLELYKVCQK